MISSSLGLKKRTFRTLFFRCNYDWGEPCVTSVSLFQLHLVWCHHSNQPLSQALKDVSRPRTVWTSRGGIEILDQGDVFVWMLAGNFCCRHLKNWHGIIILISFDSPTMPCHQHFG